MFCATSKRNIALALGASNNDRDIWIKPGNKFDAMTMVKNRHGVEMNFEAVQRQMDSDLLAGLQSLNKFEDDQALFEGYAEAHVGKYHQSFAPFTGGRW